MNVEDFLPIARIERSSIVEGTLLPPSMSPHSKASAVFSQLGGIRLVPIDDQDGQASDVHFVTGEARGFEKKINRLGSLLNRKFYPIAELAGGYAIMIMDEAGGTSQLRLPRWISLIWESSGRRFSLASLGRDPVQFSNSCLPTVAQCGYLFTSEP